MLLRQFTTRDVENLHRLDSNPEVMKYISNGVPATRERTEEVIRLIVAKTEQWKKYGCWVAEVKDSREFIGWFALKPLPQIEDIEVGYRLLPEYWGKGFATEGSKALIDYGFRDCQLEKIVAITHPQNLASQKVLLKCGLKQIGQIPDPFSKEQRPSEVLFFEARKQ